MRQARTHYSALEDNRVCGKIESGLSSNQFEWGHSVATHEC